MLGVGAGVDALAPARGEARVASRDALLVHATHGTRSWSDARAGAPTAVVRIRGDVDAGVAAAGIPSRTADAAFAREAGWSFVGSHLAHRPAPATVGGVGLGIDAGAVTVRRGGRAHEGADPSGTRL